MATAPPKVKTESPKKGSKTGFVLTLISLGASAFGSLLVHAHNTPKGPNNTTNEKVGNAVANGTDHVLGAIFGMPLLCIGIFLAILGVFFVVIRLKKPTGGGLVLSALSVAIAIWSFKIAIAAFSYLKAR
jgi:hypothetical protein